MAKPKKDAGPVDLASLDYSKAKIRIECTGTEDLPLDALEDFQGGLKIRSDFDHDQIIRSILRFGFSFPFFVWREGDHRYVLDGHGRLGAMNLFKARGGKLPLFPVAYVDAKSRDEAKQKLLRLNSNYGLMTKETVLAFSSDLAVDWTELSLPGGPIQMTDEITVPLDLDGVENSLERGDEKVCCPNCGYFLRMKQVARGHRSYFEGDKDAAG